MDYVYWEKFLIAPLFNATNAKGSATSLADVDINPFAQDAVRTTTPAIASVMIFKRVLTAYTMIKNTHLPR